MAKRKQELAVLEAAAAAESHSDRRTFWRGTGGVVGEVATAVVEDITPDGVPRVIVTGDERVREALSVLRFSCAAAASDALLGRTVLVALDDAVAPVILGVVAQRLWDTEEDGAEREAQTTLPVTDPISIQADKRRVDLEASDEIRLTCGKSSLVLRRDGTVVVRGVQIVSRASQSNKIRGATVSLN
jgi:hypothetical protein